MILLLIFSLCCFSYPALSDLINSHFNESTINEYNKNISSTSEQKINALLSSAKDYNNAIATEYFDNSKDKNYKKILSDYFNILNFDNGLIGYIEIPSIKVKLPIYHGESEDALKKGAAHLEQTSFPIGGSDTHACISAHSGYPTQKFFDDIDELTNGDIVIINVLNQKIYYKVYQKEVVEPNDITKLKVEQGKDILTLITCYPYGINSHRLLVTAERYEFKEEPQNIEKEIAVHSDLKRDFTMPLIGLIFASVTILAVINIIRVKRKKPQKSCFKAKSTMQNESFEQKGRNKND